MYDQALYDKIKSKIQIEPFTGCWIWTGFRGSYGYGQVGNGSKRVVVNGKPRTRGKHIDTHRGIWIALHGPLTRHQFVCHKCDVPPCCNPDHLFVGSLADNNRDMAAKGRYNHQQRTHCIRNHEFTPENTRIDSRGKRVCRMCERIRHSLTPEERRAYKLYDGSVRRSPKKFQNRFSGKKVA